MEIHLTKLENGVVIAATEEDAILWGRIRAGEDIAITVRSPRNPDFHRFVMALVGVTAKNWPGGFITHGQCLRWLKRKTGLVMIERNPETKELEVVEKSVRWSSMPQYPFAQWWYDHALPACANILGTTPEELTLALPKAPLKEMKTYKLRKDLLKKGNEDARPT